MPGDDPADVAQIEEVGNSPSLGSDLVRGVASAYGGEDQLELITDTVGHRRTNLPATGEAGIRPHIYVTRLDEVLRAAAEHGAPIVTLPYLEGSLTIAVLRDPAGNVIGIWQEGTH